MRIKKFLTTTLGTILVLMVVSTLILTLRGVLAKTIDLATYDHSKDAQHYIAIPFSGENFQANSYINYGVGRYYLKGKTAATILKAYEELAQSHPELQFMYAEMGWEGGGRFRPHRTHQKGMSADFMTPVYLLDATKQPATAHLPTHIFNLFGYTIRLDDHGRYEDYQMDSTALIAHIAALDQAGKNYGVRIKRVILDPPLLKILQAHPDFQTITHINFMNRRAWFPHDGHYHIDFE